MSRSKIRLVPLSGWLVLIIAAVSGMFYLQWGTNGFVGTDAYYHSRIAERIAAVWGLPPTFPWLPYTVLSPERYVDHHYLFHVLLAPFVAFDLRLGGKIAAASFASVAFVCFLRAAPKEWPLRILGAGLFFAVSPAFLYRMSMLRAQSLSLALLLIIAVCLLEGRIRTAAGLSAVYVWFYNAFPLVAILAACFGVSCYRSRKQLPWKVWGTLGVGLVAGMLVNPFFPRNLVFLYHHLIDKFQPQGYAVKVGNEWYPYTSGAFLEHLGISTALLLLAFLFSVAATAERRREVVLYLCCASIFLLMSLKSRRFVELFPPFAVLAFLWAVRETIQIYTRSMLTALLPLMILMFMTVAEARREIAGSAPYTKYAAAAAWLRLNTSEGSLVVQSDWDTFPRLFHFNVHNVYYAGLDPYFSFAVSPESFERWRKFTKARNADDVHRFLDAVDAEIFLVDAQHERLQRRLEQVPQLKRVFRSEEATIFIRSATLG